MRKGQGRRRDNDEEFRCMMPNRYFYARGPRRVSSESARAPRITILLCTYNGARYLSDQLGSYLVQDYRNWDLWVSDDGSQDETNRILQDFRARHGGERQIRLLRGPARGVNANFLSLLCHPELPPGPVALSDQDDVWFPDKLTRAATALRDYEGTGVAAIYGAQSIYTDRHLRMIGRSAPPRRTPSFRNALVQNIVSGHSTVLNAEALKIVRQAGMQELTWHDWWLYQLISGAGGKVLIDPTETLFYRQHNHAAMGAHHGLRASLRRAGRIMSKDYRSWIGANLVALARSSDLLTPGNRSLLRALRETPAGPGRASLMVRSGIYRQDLATSAILYAAALCGRA